MFFDLYYEKRDFKDHVGVDVSTLERHFVYMVPVRAPMTIDSLLNVPEQDHQTDELDSDMFFEDRERKGDRKSELQETEPIGHSLPSLYDQLNTLPLAKIHICSGHDSYYSNVSDWRRSQSSIRLEVSLGAI